LCGDYENNEQRLKRDQPFGDGSKFHVT